MSDENLRQPYPPSWFDRFKAWVEHLPMPAWLFYLIAGLVFYPVLTISQWDAGTYPVGTFSIFHLWLSLEFGYSLAMMHYLDKVAADALTKMRSVLKIGGEDYERLEYQLVTLPARPTLVISLLSTVLAVGIFAPITYLSAKDGVSIEYQVSIQPVSMLVFGIGMALSWFVNGTLIVHTLRQLQMVSRIYREHVRVDLFNLDPLYAFSGLTARTAILLLGIPYFWFTTSSPALTTIGVAVGAGLVFAIIAIVTFALPLWGVHQRLVQEKSQVIAENRRRTNALVQDSHRSIDAGDLNNAAKVRDALTVLDIHFKAIAPIPTWPWSPETFRLIVSAILLPMVLFLFQYVLRRFLGG